MSKLKKILSMLLIASTIWLVSCTENLPTSIVLEAPVVSSTYNDEIEWTEVEHAVEYELKINGTIYIVAGNHYVFDNFGSYQVSVRAIAEQATIYRNSLWSDTFTLTFTTFNYVGVVILETTYIELTVGQTFDLNAQTLPETNQTLDYQSSNQQIVSVSNGLITANALGTSTISVSTRRYHTAYIEVNVYPNIQNESGTQISIEIGDLYNLAITVTPTLSEIDQLTYESSDDTVVFVGVTGVLSALKAGEAVITIRSSYGGILTISVIVTPVLPAVITFSIVVPQALPEEFHMYLVGSFNSWSVKDQTYRMQQDEENPLRYYITLTNLTSKTEVQYKYIMGSTTQYAWENYQNSPVANRSLFVVGGASTINDIVDAWQALNNG